MELAKSARTAALGSTIISLSDGDLTQFFENPATLDSVKSSDVAVLINPFFAETASYTIAYVADFKKIGKFAVGLNYVDFGKFERRDASGNLTGEFNANDYSFFIGKSHRVGPFVMGMNVKLLHSSIASFGSTALLSDVGGIFQVNKSWTVGLTFSNLGGRLSNFNELIESDIPFDVKIGTSFKPEYMPIRFTLTTNNLVQDNLIEQEDSEGRSNEQLEKVLRRINIGAELLLSEHFQLLFGYSHKRKQELKLEDISGGAGFSYGIMLNIKKIELRFSRLTYNAAGGTSFISLRTNLNQFKSIL